MKFSEFLLSIFFSISLIVSASSSTAQSPYEPLATVNGETISNAEVDYIVGTSFPSGVETVPVGDVVRQLVRNILLSQAYLDDYSLSEDEEHALSRVQRIMGLAQLKIQDVNATIDADVLPNDPRINIILEDNATAFEDRKLIVYWETGDFSASDAFWSSLSDFTTPDAVTEYATQNSVKFDHTVTSAFTDALPSGFRTLLLDAPLNTVVVARQGTSSKGRLFLVKHVYDAPITGTAAEARARRVLVQTLQRQALEKIIADKTKSSVITYSDRLDQLDTLPRGTSEEAIKARKTKFLYYLLGLCLLGMWGAVTHVSILRCWTGRFYVPFSAWFSEDAKEVKLKLNYAMKSFNAMEKSLNGDGKVATFVVSAIGWIVYAALIALAAREYPYLTPTAILASVLLGFAFTAMIATPQILRVTGQRRTLVMIFNMSVFFAGALAIAYAYQTHVGSS